MVLPHSGQAVRVVELGVALAPDPEKANVQQPSGARQDLLPTKGASRQVSLHLGAQPWEGLGEICHARELLPVPLHPPGDVIEVLTATLDVQSRCLKVAVGPRADPHLSPGRRNGKGLNALDGLFVNRLTVRVAIREATPPPEARNSWARAVGPAQSHHRSPAIPDSLAPQTR